MRIRAGLGVKSDQEVLARCYFLPRFRPVAVKEVIHLVLMEALADKQYNCDEAKNWTREISDSIQTKLKGFGRLNFAGSIIILVFPDLQLDRYKYIVQVVIGEQRGEGVRQVIGELISSLCTQIAYFFFGLQDGM